VLYRGRPNLEISAGFQFKRVTLDLVDHSDSTFRYIYGYTYKDHPHVPEQVDSDQFYSDIFPVIENAESIYKEADSVWVYVSGVDTVKAYRLYQDATYGDWQRSIDERFYTSNPLQSSF